MSDTNDTTTTEVEQGAAPEVARTPEGEVAASQAGAESGDGTGRGSNHVIPASSLT